MQKLRRQLVDLYEELKKSNILGHVNKRAMFSDEPKMHTYSADVRSDNGTNEGKTWNGKAGGFSFFSKELALIKCLSEAAERFCNSSYIRKDFQYASFNGISDIALDPSLFLKTASVKEKKFAWVKGYDLINKVSCLIPAQLTYFTYKFIDNEPILSDLNSTGAAGGFDHETTLLRGIYETVERDAFLGIYLTRSAVPRINISLLPFSEVRYIESQASRYNLELRLYDITNDLEIPSFMAVLLDRTGLGPTISIGLKSSLSPKTAIIGALEESFHTRPWIKGELLRRNGTVVISPDRNISSILERAFLWIDPDMLNKLSFILDQPIKEKHYVLHDIDSKQELERIVNIFTDKKISLYYVDISNEKLRKINYIAYKAIIPELQFFYLDESRKNINTNRLQTIASYFGKREYVLNEVPHPFL